MTRILGGIDCARTGLMIGLACAVVAGAAVQLTSLELRSGGRGIALVLNGDEEFPVDANVPAARRNAGRYTVGITVPQAVCAMRLRHFSVFPEGCPVSDIVVREKPSSALEIVVSMSLAPDKTPIVKNKGARQLVLISSRACAESEWLSASAADIPADPPAAMPAPGAKPARQTKPPAAAAAAPAGDPAADRAPAAAPKVHQPAPVEQVQATVLRDLAVLQRGDVAQVMLNMSGPFSYEIKPGKLQVVLTLPAVTSGLGESSFKIGNSPVTKIDIKEKKHAGSAGCRVTIALEPGTPVVSYALESANRLIVMIPVTAKSRFVVWSAARNTAVSSDWTSEVPHAEPPRPTAPAGTVPPVAAAKPLAAMPTPAPAAGPGRTPETSSSVIPAVRPSGTPVSTAAAAVPGPDTAAQAKPVVVDSVRYTVYGRDPFIPYTMETDPTLPTVDNLKLVGVLFGNTDRIALLQDRNDSRRAYALRELDLVRDGSVMRINRTNVIFLLTEMGISRTFSLELPGDNTIVKTY